MTPDPAQVCEYARECGFELCGVTPAAPSPDTARFDQWAAAGHAGRMGYLTDHRQAMRHDPRTLLADAQTIICVGKLYNGGALLDEARQPGRARIARYAWGADYHRVMTEGLEKLARMLGEHRYKVCVDTAPLLERSYAQHAGLGWIGKNTCLINQESGSWFFLGELLTTLRIEGPRDTAADRCGTCTRCIEACPTEALATTEEGYTLDARRCISYLTIELRGEIPEELRAQMDNHVFGCDICQDVCPWNSRAPVTQEFGAQHQQLGLAEMAALTPEQFQAQFRDTPIPRARYTGFLRNVAIAMGNAPDERFRPALEFLARSDRPVVSEAAQWALRNVTRPQSPR